ncbi:hypothetical protein ACFSKN_01540 [Mariniflexile gromovii]|uniref:Uncharacterized protein n=1 Tax=Mariniflexile gromovii TaxID=362523 RepID=A0ABS4BSJ6_9FLAO|nr:hypothetical protein [Mariniflexile gromovii]MBP0903559.1 hypothetical protein [Mariniflexile gromovii]
MRTRLEFQKERYELFNKNMNDFASIFCDVIKELGKQGIDGYSFEELKEGNFQKLFEDYHKNQQLKNEVTKNMIYEKYLDLYGYNDAELKKLETNYKRYLDREFSFYLINDSFYEYCKNNFKQNPLLKSFLENAPEIKIFKIFDFVNIKGNNIKIDVPEELFTLYATSHKQLETMKNIKEFVRVAKKLEMTSNDILEPLVKYLNHKDGSFFINGTKGLSDDLNTINFNYHKILTIQS